MKTNIFIIHHARLGENLYWIPNLKNKLLTMGYNVIVPMFPDIYTQSFDTWKTVLDKYRDKINNNTIFIGYSTGAIFTIKYLLTNNLSIRKFISVAGFNNFSNPNTENELIKNIDKANKTFFVDDITKFNNLCNNIVCYYSNNDNFISQNALQNFGLMLNAKQIIIPNAGHFNKGTKCELEFKEMLNEF